MALPHVYLPSGSSLVATEPATLSGVSCTLLSAGSGMHISFVNGSVIAKVPPPGTVDQAFHLPMKVKISKGDSLINTGDDALLIFD